MTDTRTQHSQTRHCYCETCCATAADWYEWRSIDDQQASGARYWTVTDALRDKDAAIADGLPRLVHQPEWNVLQAGGGRFA